MIRSVRYSLAALALAVSVGSAYAAGETTTYKADLKGASEVPANATKGTGEVTATYDPGSKMLSWKGSYSGSYSGTFTIHWRLKASGALTGKITLSRPQGTYGISGKVRGFAITFGAVGAGATYTGSVSGSSMSGKYKTGDGGSGHWNAHKTS